MHRKKVKIFIVFERHDIEVIQHLVSNKDFIFGDLDLKKTDRLDSTLISRQITPDLFEEQLKSTSATVRNFFADQMVKIDEDLFGFINNFYEATLVPILSYIFALDDLVKSIEKKGGSVSLVFPRQIRLAKNSSFFLAEHEAQSVFLYHRAAVFQPYLLDKFSSSHEILYINASRLCQQTTSNIRQFTRLWTVFFVRFGYAVARCLLVRPSSVKFKPSLNTIVITRTPNKSEYIADTLTESNKIIGVCVGENFGRIIRNYRFCKKNLTPKHFSILQMCPPQILLIFKEYFRAAIKILAQKKNLLLISGNKIDITQSTKEMLVLLPDLKIYIHSLEAMIKGLDNLSLVVSTELKSPYAYGESKVSILNELKCVHLQDCDYLASPIPIPIFGDALVIRDPNRLQLYKSAWTMYGAEKVYASQKKPSSHLNRSENPDKLTWCFFTSAVTKNDQLVMGKLREINRVYGLNFMVKLHPRDSIWKYFRYWRKFKFYRDGDISKKSLFGLFNAALTFSSAVINDLEDSKIPYMLLDIDPISHFNNSAHFKKSNEQVIRSFKNFLDKFMWAHQNFLEFKDTFEFKNESDRAKEPSAPFLEEIKKIVNA